MNSLPWPCLMLVTEQSPRLMDCVDEAIDGGVNAVQWREKRAIGAGYFQAYKGLCDLTEDRAALIVNGNWESAARRGARAIHLPEQSAPIGVVRHKIGQKSLIGKSVHSVESAQRAAAQGADYLIAGTIFSSSSHPGETPQGVEFLAEVCAAVPITVIAIGGIKPENIPECLEAGAKGVAVLSPIMRAASPRGIAHQYRQALDTAWETLKCK